MRDGWVQTTLGEILERRSERAGHSGIELVLSVTEKNGIRPQTEVFNKRVATADTSKYKVLHPLDIAYNPYLLWTGAIGQWLGLEPGVTSPVYECFRVKAPHDARFVGLMLTSGLLTPYFDSTAIGSIQRRRRTTPDVFDAAVLDLPSPVGQRRIADLIASIDVAIEANDVYVQRLEAVVESLMREVFGSRAESATQLGDLVTMFSGPSWAAAQESGIRTPDSIPVLKITNTTSQGDINLSEVAYVVGLPESTKRLRTRDLVLIRTNGNRKRIGNVYRIDESAEGFAYSAFQIGVSPKPGTSSAFLYWSLRAPWVQGAITEAASGTTGLGNIAISWLRKLPLWMPTADEQARIVELFNSLEDARTAGQMTKTSLLSLRSQALNDLLSGDHLIPGSYDRFLETAS